MLYIIIGAVELGLIYSLMSLGLFMSYRILNVADLTVDGSFTTGAAVSAMLAVNGHPLLGLLCAIPAGAAAGLITSLLQTKLKIQPILSGILTMTFLYSANLWIMGNRSNLSLLGKTTVFSSAKELFGSSSKLPVILLTVLLACLFLGFFLRTKTGLSVRATGDNVEMVRASSINPHYTNAIALCIANALVALSGGLLAQYQQSADISMGIGMVVIGLASVIIGEVIIGSSSINRHILAILAGSVLYRCFIAMALRAASSNDLKAISAVIVTIAISYPTIKELFAVRKLKKEARNG
ncbi:MAG: ABC transporter permease [Angelakisella sp.]